MADGDAVETSGAADIETALEALPVVNDVTVTGSGTLRDPWQVEFLDALKDGKGNYRLLTVSNSDLVSAPMDGRTRLRRRGRPFR